jgi:hypothetical protein
MDADAAKRSRMRVEPPPSLAADRRGDQRPQRPQSRAARRLIHDTARSIAAPPATTPTSGYRGRGYT